MKETARMTQSTRMKCVRMRQSARIKQRVRMTQSARMKKVHTICNHHQTVERLNLSWDKRACSMQRRDEKYKILSMEDTIWKNYPQAGW